MPSARQIPWVQLQTLALVAGMGLGIGVGEWWRSGESTHENFEQPALAGPTRISSGRSFHSSKVPGDRESPAGLARALVAMLRTPGGESADRWRTLGRDLIRCGPSPVMEAVACAGISGEEMQTLLLLTARAVSLADSGRSLEWLDALTPFCDSDSNRDNLLFNACETAANENPRLIWNAMLQMKPSYSRDQLQGLSLANLLNLQNHETAISLLESRRATSFDREFAESFALALVNTQPDTARQIVLELPDGPLRETLAGQLSSSIAMYHPDDLMSWLDDLPASLKQASLLGEIPIDLLARGSFESVAEFLQITAEFKGGEAWTSALLSEWTHQNPSAASSLLTDRGDLLTSDTKAIIAISLALTSPAVAADCFASFSDPAVQVLTAGYLARQHFAKSTEAAESFAASLSNSDAREAARKHIAWKLANKEPDNACIYLAKNPEATTKITASVLTDHLIQSNPAEALAWLCELPSAWQPGLFQQATGFLADDDFKPASEWAKSISDARNRDAAYSAIANQIDTTRPAEALEWVAAIEDPQERSRVLLGKFKQWSLSDHACAEDWLNESSGAFPENLAALRQIQEQSRVFILSNQHATRR
jgi:hypothetical protein